MMKKIELFILTMMLRRREKLIVKEFDQQLSQEIDCLLMLIEGCKNERTF